MSDAISHRGPDDADALFLAGEGVGLAHRRLSIIDLSAAGRQPMWDTTRSVCIVFNGEIYNYRELRAELERERFAVLESHRHRGHSQSLSARRRRDARKAEWHLRVRALGLPVALASRRSRRTRREAALLREDPTRIPFRQRAQGPRSSARRFAIARHRRGAPVHPISLVPRAADDARGRPKTAPGHAAWVKQGEIVKEWEFYDLPFDGEPEGWSDADAIASTRDVIAAAVERQMVADVPVGAFLSGGLDSSAVVAFARAHNGDRAAQVLHHRILSRRRGGRGRSRRSPVRPLGREIARRRARGSERRTGVDGRSLVDGLSAR